LEEYESSSRRLLLQEDKEEAGPWTPVTGIEGGDNGGCEEDIRTMIEYRVPGGITLLYWWRR
jgi:hypothetical protein